MIFKFLDFHHVSAYESFETTRHYMNTILFVKVPIPSMNTSTLSPSFSQTFGFIPIPTPDGVPVKMRLPASSVVP